MELAGVATAIPGLRFSSPFRYRCHNGLGVSLWCDDRNPVAFDARRVAEFHSSVAVPNDRFPSREPKSSGALGLWSAWIGFGGYKVDLPAVIYLKF
jgi:hypothetical protein